MNVVLSVLVIQSVRGSFRVGGLTAPSNVLNLSWRFYFAISQHFDLKR
jgi:hypothetical protein